jgi:tetratricopeptide (TPR) repeat protein
MPAPLIGALLLLWQPDPAALVPLYQQALEQRRKELGPDHPKVARLASDFGLFQRKIGSRDAAVELLRLALAIDEKRFDRDSRLVAEDLENLASVLPPQDAILLYQRAAQCKDPAVAARNLARLAAVEDGRGNRTQAINLYREALVREELASGPSHPRVAVRLNDVALVIEPPQAEPLLRRALAIQEETLGARHPELAVTLNNLANVLLATGRIQQAEPLARRALATLEESLGPNHPRVATSASNLADVLRAKKDLTGARRLYQRALEIDEKFYGPQNAEVAVDLDNLAALLDEMGMGAEAAAARKRAQSINSRR